ncbi:MAG TPA: LapA family protein [Burkholderiales bacterium]|nr:LapA family protein [Burkholderiales bacterium]
MSKDDAASFFGPTMRYLLWILRLTLFLLLFGFALKNNEPTALRYYLGYQWQAPLSLLLLVFFTLGVGTGLMASLATIFRQRREISQLKKKGMDKG